LIADFDLLLVISRQQNLHYSFVNTMQSNIKSEAPSNHASRINRLRAIVEVCRQKNITPQNNTFADLVLRVCCSKFGVTLKTAKEYTQTLNVAWRADQWNTLENNAGEVTLFEDKIEVVEDPANASIPLKYRLWDWLRSHPNRPKRGFLREAAIDLHLNYSESKKTLWDYSSEFKTVAESSTRFGAGPKNSVMPKSRIDESRVKDRPDSQHACYAVCEVPSCLDRKRFVEVEKLAIDAGWRPSKNRNRELIFEKRLSIGRIEWWVNGHVHIHVEKPQTLGRAKGLVYEAFVSTGLIDSVKISEAFLASVEWFGSHDVFNTGSEKPLPQLTITAYEILGLKKIKIGDLSHLYDVETEVVKPPLLVTYEKLVTALTGAFEKDVLEKAGVAKAIQSSNEVIANFNAYLQKQEAQVKETPKRLYE
jgi:hypothetical protein